jgi:hypothetical protein
VWYKTFGDNDDVQELETRTINERKKEGNTGDEQMNVKRLSV